MGKSFLLTFMAILPVLLCASIKREGDARKDSYPLTSPSSLQFSNTTGSGTTKEMINSFIDIANYASLTYGDDLEKNSKYIKLRMDEFYGLEDDNFFIFIQSDQVITNKYFWVISYNVFAGLAGINKLYPKWSYYFARSYGDKKIAEYNYITKNQIGGGIDNGLLTFIRDLIRTYQAEDTCLCTKESVTSIGQKIKERESNTWTVICDNKGVTTALIQTFYKRFLSLKQKNCYYTMYYSV